MSQYVISRACGHAETIQITGTNVHGERERRAGMEATRPCADCIRSATQDAAAVTAAERGWPTLAGTAKQVDWAQRIRVEVAGQLDDFRATAAARLARRPEQADRIEATLNALDDAFQRHIDAGWWIDHRGAAALIALKEEARGTLRGASA